MTRHAVQCQHALHNTCLSAKHRLASLGALRQQQRCFLRPRLRWTRGLHLKAEGSSDDGEEEAASIEQARAQLTRTFSQSHTFSGTELRQLIWQKWGRSYDCRLHKRGNRVYVQVMWKFLEQQSFALTEQQYVQQLDAVASYISLWGAQETVRNGIASANKRGPGFTGGGGARAISIPLGVDLGSRGTEWNSF